MALIAVTGFMTIMLLRIFAARLWHVVTTLAYTGTLVICIFPLAAGVTEIDGTGHSALFHITTNQIDVCTLGVGRIVWIVLDVSAMAVNTLNILVSAIVALFVRMAVRADVQFVRRAV